MTTHDDLLTAILTVTNELEPLLAHDRPTRSQQQRISELTGKIADLELQRVRSAMQGGYVEAGTPSGAPDSEATPGTSPVRGRALTMIERHASPLLTDEARQRVTVAVENDVTDRTAAYVTHAADGAYARAFGALVRDPLNGHRTWSDEELRAFRGVEAMRAALNLNDASGGFLVPFHLDPNVILTNTGAINPMREVCRVEQITTDVWHGVTSAGVSAEWLAEAAEAADASPTFAQPGIPTHKGASYVQASLEVSQDASNLDQVLAAMFADARSRKEADAFINGTGVGQPTGLITALVAAGKTVPSTTADTFASADVVKLLGAVPARWRANSVVIAGFPILAMISQFESGAGARLYPEAADGRLINRRLLEVTGMDETITATQTNYLMAAFDPAQFVIVDRLGSVVVFDPNIRGINRRPTGEVSWTLYWRSGSDLVSTDAGRVLDV
jgi:HK97 family phage major capsid protein